MAKEFFKDLPNTTTPLTASRLNDLLDGEEPMGNLVVDSIRSKNMFDYKQATNGAIVVNSTSETLDYNTQSLTSGWILCKSNTNYILSGSANRGRWQTKSSNGTITYITTQAPTLTTPSDAKYFRVYYYYQDSGNVSPIDINDIQIEEGTTATNYVPYQNLNPISYSLITDNDWEVKMYDDGTFEAWYPYTNTSTTTCNNVFVANALYNSPSITITGPSIVKSIIHYQVNASFTTTNSWPAYWVPVNTFNLRFQLICNTNITSATTYRQSAYMMGTWK